ncbi:MAG: response regulator [candidate division Zixibacteria bacterium]
MTFEIIGSILFFALTLFALIFSSMKSSRIDRESFPNKARFFSGLIIWMMTSLLAILINWPGYSQWFIPVVYPILQISLIALFLLGFFLVLTTVNAFPIHLDIFRKESTGQVDRYLLLDNIRHIASQPYSMMEQFALVLKEIASYLVVKKGAVFLINRARGEMYLAAQIGLSKEEMHNLERFPLGQDIISRAASEQRSFISDDLVTSDSSSRRLILAGRKLTFSAAAIPMSARDQSLGTMLVLSNRAGFFEKSKRLLLTAAAEIIAREIESNRLIRENQKHKGRLEATRELLSQTFANVNHLAKSGNYQKQPSDICRFLVERFNLLACRVVMLSKGKIENLASHQVSAYKPEQSESYLIAVIESIRRGQMIILNQEARNPDGSVFINRSTLLCPFSLWKGGEYALLIDYSGGSLSVNESLLQEIETSISIISIALNIVELKNADSLSQTAVTSLINILEIKNDSGLDKIYNRFLKEIVRFLPKSAAAMVFVADNGRGYRVQAGYSEEMRELAFIPGEGPVGKAAATGDILEYNSANDIEIAWGELEPVNKDFLIKLCGERGVPKFQINIPVVVMDAVTAIVSIFDFNQSSLSVRKEKGLLLLSAQLLSIKLTTTEMDNQIFMSQNGSIKAGDSAVLNRINNYLATITGRAQLLSRKADIHGPTRYTAGEILKASESAAESIKRLQKSIIDKQNAPDGQADDLTLAIDEYLSPRHITANLYMFDDNRTLVLEKDIDKAARFAIGNDNLISLIESILKQFVNFIGDGEQVLLKSVTADDAFYFNIIRGSREYTRDFKPSDYDYGEPDVLPKEFISAEMIGKFINLNAQVSFDRFGRQPTYVSFKFPNRVDSSEIISTSSSDSNALTILAVDDQQMILDLLSGICQSLGFRLTAVKSPAEGMILIRSNKYDIVMVDLVMGDISGWDVAREVKKHSPSTPVVMMTGWGLNLTEEQTSRAGVDFTLAKPFKIEQLTEVISQARQKHNSY